MTENASSTRFTVGFAASRHEILEAQRLRYLVFGQELGARLPAADRGIDEDEFDPHCDHLLVRDRLSGSVVGTYRVLPPEAAGETGGLYTDREFDLTFLQPLRRSMVEVGRACVHPAYRSAAVMLLMWSALARYVIEGGYGHFVGVASIPLDDGGQLAASVFHRVRSDRFSPESLRVFPRNPLALDRFEAREPAGIPPLLKGYLGMGAWVCGEPAVDPDFNCADLPILLSLERLDARFARHFLKRAA
ncbi:MAG: GNAT family N-acetyltransferase [Betaproteobacteria bacterium]|nr:MAG: GNAT family N-acetyltransferase [Betaproteobacteria bacterium]